MELFGKTPGRDDKTGFRVGVASFPDGSPISLEVKVIVGVNKGPTVTLLGVQHGDEYNGMEVVNRLMDGLEPEDLTGTVIGIPVSNPLAFNTGMRVTPPSVGYENLNLTASGLGTQRGSSWSGSPPPSGRTPSSEQTT